jgi:uncharacterized membrane protein
VPETVKSTSKFIGKVLLAAFTFTVIWIVIAVAANISGLVAGVVGGAIVAVGALTAYTLMAIKITRERHERERGQTRSQG